MAESKTPPRTAEIHESSRGTPSGCSSWSGDCGVAGAPPSRYRPSGRCRGAGCSSAWWMPASNSSSLPTPARDLLHHHDLRVPPRRGLARGHRVRLGRDEHVPLGPGGAARGEAETARRRLGRVSLTFTASSRGLRPPVMARTPAGRAARRPATRSSRATPPARSSPSVSADRARLRPAAASRDASAAWSSFLALAMWQDRIPAQPGSPAPTEGSRLSGGTAGTSST